jgi:hypothetical protein
MVYDSCQTLLSTFSRRGTETCRPLPVYKWQRNTSWKRGTTIRCNTLTLLDDSSSLETLFDAEVIRSFISTSWPEFIAHSRHSWIALKRVTSFNEPVNKPINVTLEMTFSRRDISIFEGLVRHCNRGILSHLSSEIDKFHQRELSKNADHIFNLTDLRRGGRPDN